MIIALLKNVCIYLICFVVFRNTIENSKQLIPNPFLYILFSLLLSITTLICKTYFQLGSYVIPFVLYYVFLMFRSSVSPLKLLSSSLFSYSLTQMLLCISTMAVGFITYPLRHYDSNGLINVLAILSCCLTAVLAFVLFRNPKSKSIIHAINSYPSL